MDTRWLFDVAWGMEPYNIPAQRHIPRYLLFTIHVAWFPAVSSQWNLLFTRFSDGLNTAIYFSVGFRKCFIPKKAGDSSGFVDIFAVKLFVYPVW
jgi:hypothetical protein